MKLKKLHLSMMATAVALCNVASAQLFVDNATLFIQTGAVVTVQGDVTSNVDIQGPGTVLLKGSANQNVSMTNHVIPNLEIDNAANTTLTTAARVGTNLKFTNGSILLGANDLTLDAAATITTPASNKFVVTNGAGKMVKSALTTAFLYPVGNSLTTYNPVTLTNTGTSDAIGVRCLANVLSAGTSGTPLTKEVVDASWDISEAVAGGSNLAMTAQWTQAPDELAGFNRNKSGISYYIPTAGPTQGWDMLNNVTGAAAGANPYTFTRSGVTSLGTFAIGGRPVLSPLLITPKVFLQGPYNTGTNLMNTSLATLNLIPLTEPYSTTTGFTHIASGSGGGETVANAAVFTSNLIVDWVFVSLHDAGTGAVVSTRSGLLQNDGDVVETDGITPLNMAGNAPSNYYISVRHRNHLGVRSAAAQNLTGAKTTFVPYNFATGLSQALANAAVNQMTNKYTSATTTANYMMWAGDANSNKVVRYAGAANDENILLNTAPLSGNKAGISAQGYWQQDFNLNGVVRYAGSLNDENILINVSLLGSKALIVNQATF